MDDKLKKMNIKICKWKNDSNSPVLFWIDDFTNRWVDINNNSKIDIGEDWGYAKNYENSMFRFLSENILNHFLNLRTTFFVPVSFKGRKIKNSKIKSISLKINHDDESKFFFKNIHNDSKFELAYHGTTHGRFAKTEKGFIQEWDSFESLEEAIKTIEIGKEIFRDAVEKYPKGGKYCGYKDGKFGDKSINESGFLWWCRYYNNNIYYKFFRKFNYIYFKYIKSTNSFNPGNDINPITNYDLKVFGKNNIIDIPTTLPGNLFNFLFKKNLKIWEKIIYKIFKNFLFKIRLKRIEFLLNNKLVISIQEHISPSIEDGIIQVPNIFTDKESLKFMFYYFKKKKVWYCTGSELAEYYWLRGNTSIEIIDDNLFLLKYNQSKELSNMILSLKINKGEKIILPNGKRIRKEFNIFNLEVMNGNYEICS